MNTAAVGPLEGVPMNTAEGVPMNTAAVARAVTVRDPRIDRAAAYVLGVVLTVAVALGGWFLSSLRTDVRTCLDSNAACSARLAVLEAILARIEKRLDSSEGPRK